MDIWISCGFEFRTPPLGSLPCRSGWSRREPSVKGLCTIVLLHAGVEIRDEMYRSGYEVGILSLLDGYERGNCAYLVPLAAEFRRIWIVASTRNSLRNVRHGFGFAGDGSRTWLLELSICVFISCLASTRAHYSRFVWLHAA